MCLFSSLTSFLSVFSQLHKFRPVAHSDPVLSCFGSFLPLVALQQFVGSLLRPVRGQRTLGPFLRCFWQSLLRHCVLPVLGAACFRFLFSFGVFPMATSLFERTVSVCLFSGANVTVCLVSTVIFPFLRLKRPACFRFVAFL